jgi:hypothetical protein
MKEKALKKVVEVGDTLSITSSHVNLTNINFLKVFLSLSFQGFEYLFTYRRKNFNGHLCTF